MLKKLSEGLRKAADLYSIGGKEFIFLTVMWLILLVINYFLIALHGFSLSYSKSWPGAGVVMSVIPQQLLLWCGYFLLRRSRWYLWSVVSIHFLVFFILLGIYLTTGTFFCESILFLVYDTTLAETGDFISAYVSFKAVAILLLTAAGFFGGLYFLMKLAPGKKRYCRGDCFALLTIAVLMIYPLARMINAHGWSFDRIFIAPHPFCGIYGHIRLFNEHAGSFTVEMRHRTPPENTLLHPALKSNPPLGILVIGESAIRSHHAIYGYFRNTTPNLLAEKDNIVTFNDTIAVLPMTITALKYWLTDMTLENRHVSWTLFDALKQAGYRIDVITNQNKSGWADSPLQMIFATADSITYMHEENYSDLYEDRNAGIYDGNLLPELERTLAKQERTPRLIVIHLFGSHDPYRSRYPEGFSRQFLDDTSTAPLINEYDTSVLYTDFILSKIISALKKFDHPSYMIYFSDHGSVCDPQRLRTPGSVENSAYEIPFLIWSNPRYRELLPETSARIKKSSNVPLQADKAHYGLLEMMGVHIKEDDGKLNFLSPEFELRPRTVREGAMPYVKEQK